MEVRPDRENETQFLPTSGRIDTAIWMHYAASNIEQVLEATPHKPAAIRPPTTHHKNFQS